MLDVNTFLKFTKRILYFPDFTILEKRPRVFCADGFNVSIQASEGHYCRPRSDDAEKYESVDLGYPSEGDDLIMEYAEDLDDPTKTIYANVPVEIVNELLNKHGGIVGARR